MKIMYAGLNFLCPHMQQEPLPHVSFNSFIHLEELAGDTFSVEFLRVILVGLGVE